MAKEREDGKVLMDQIAKEEAKLIGLEKEQKEVRARIEALRAKLASIEACEAEQASTELVRDVRVSDEAAEKARLFAGLFRGRSDVYPKLWINRRTGRKGYSPACANEWVRGLCDKKKVKCGQCQNKAFLPVTDEAILEHLRGRHVMGVYPLLEDETCWFLAVDFDKSSWMEDVKAFAETCREFDIPVNLERSRSGNGAHAWFFFTAPVPAGLARKMGCYFLTETMSRRHQLSMESYDRLFPNQDTMPRGGFGNLIALPLQRESVRQGNTVFLDSDLEPFPDQWSYLAGLRRIEPKTVDKIAKEAVRQGRVIGVRTGESADEKDATPWMHPRLRAASRQSSRGFGTAIVRREGRASVGSSERDQAPGRLPKPRVLQEAEHAVVDRENPAGHRLFGGASRPHGSPQRLRRRPGKLASRAQCWARRRGQTADGRGA